MLAYKVYWQLFGPNTQTALEPRGVGVGFKQSRQLRKTSSPRSLIKSKQCRVGKGILVVTFFFLTDKSNLVHLSTQSVSSSPYITAAASKPLDWTGHCGLAHHRLNALPLSFHIFKQQWFVTLIPDTWATPANGKETPIYCAQLFFVAHRTEGWDGSKWL